MRLRPKKAIGSEESKKNRNRLALPPVEPELDEELDDDELELLEELEDVLPVEELELELEDDDEELEEELPLASRTRIPLKVPLSSIVSISMVKLPSFTAVRVGPDV